MQFGLYETWFDHQQGIKDEPKFFWSNTCHTYMCAMCLNMCAHFYIWYQLLNIAEFEDDEDDVVPTYSGRICILFYI